MLRKVTLSILMLVSIVTILPLAESAAHGIRQTITQHRRHRHHSRRWWRRHRAMKRRRAAMAHRSAPLVAALPRAAVGAPGTPVPAAVNTLQVPTNASLSVVALSRPAPAFLTQKEQHQILGGVSFGELRRIVIDKMIATGGWVTNDFEREVGGHRVFVVTAQTPADARSPEKSWNYYFTEVNGRIYSLKTEATGESSERMASEAEKFIASLR
jgi:hypothetical protein